MTRIVNIKTKHELGIGKVAGDLYILCYYYDYYYKIKLISVIHDLFLLFSLPVCVISDCANNIL